MNKHFKILHKLIICGFITTQIYTPITIGASTFHITPNKYPIITKTKYGITELNNISTYSINNKTYINYAISLMHFILKSNGITVIKQSFYLWRKMIKIL